MAKVSLMARGDFKTAEEVEGDIYKAVRAYLNGKIKGYSYRRDTRPTNRGDKEDAVVSFLSGLDGQVQTGVVVVNVYVPNVDKGDHYRVKDSPRVTEASRLLLNMIKEMKIDGYDLRTERTVQTEEDNGATRVTLRIKYKYNALIDRQ